MVVTSREEEQEVADYLTSAARKQRLLNACAQFPFSLFKKTLGGGRERENNMVGTRRSEDNLWRMVLSVIWSQVIRSGSEYLYMSHLPSPVAPFV